MKHVKFFKIKSQSTSSNLEVYNGMGQLALLTTPGAKPGLDEAQVVFGEAFAVLAAMLSFTNLSQGESLREWSTYPEAYASDVTRFISLHLVSCFFVTSLGGFVFKCAEY